MTKLKSWAFRRPFCVPAGGFVLAKTGSEAIELINYAHGYASHTSIFCAETGEKYGDDLEGNDED